MARYMRTDLGRGHTNLRPPVVVTEPAPFVARPLQVELAPSHRLSRRAQSQLHPPAVIGAGRVNPGLRIKLTFGRRGAPRSHLSPPAVVTQPTTEVFSGPPPTFAPQRRGRATYDLAGPIVVDSGAALGWLATSLAPQRRGQAKSFLGEPVVAPAVVQIYYGPQVTLAPSARRPGRALLSPPAVIGASRVNPGLRIKLTFGQSRRGVANLFPPAVVTPELLQIYYGPEVVLARRRTPPTTSFLRAPVVVDEQPCVFDDFNRTDESPVAGNWEVNLQDPGSGNLYLTGNQLVRAPEGGYGAAWWNTDVLGSDVTVEATVTAKPASGRMEIYARLRNPGTGSVSGYLLKLDDQVGTDLWRLFRLDNNVEVYISGGGTPAGDQFQEISSGDRIRLRCIGSSIEAWYRSALGPWTLIQTVTDTTYAGPGYAGLGTDSGGAWDDFSADPCFEIVRPPSIQLAASSRGRAKSFLRAAIVAPAVAQIHYGPEISLTRGRRGAPYSFLTPPKVVFLAVEILGPEVHLARIKHPPVQSQLSPPTVVRLAVEIYGPEQTLVRIRPQQRFSILSPPTVITQPAGVLYPVSVNLTYSRRPVTKGVLRPPAVVGAGRVNPGLRVKLTFGRRPVAKSRLFPPVLAVVVVAAVYYGPQTSLTRIRPRRTLALLQPPAVINPDVSFDGPGVLLTRSSRGRPKSIMRKPVVVTPIVVVYFGPSTTLTYSRRGRPRSFLRPPRVVAQAPARAEVQPPWLTYSRRGRPKSFLRKPVVVFPFRARPTAVLLAPQSRGRPAYFLNPPQVVRLAVEIYGPETWLTYSRRGRPQYRLEPPAVVGKAPFRGIKTWLTRIKPRPTVALLKPPTVVRVPTAGLLQVHLTYSRRGRPVYFTTPFTPGKAPFRPIQVHLTRITPRPTVSLIKPPSVVGAGIAFFGPSVTLVRITPPPVISFLKLTLVAFRRPGGDVCGFDIAGSFVCYLELPGSQVSGSERAGAQVSGSSRAGSTMTGSENAGSNVSGSDRKAT